MPKFIPWDTIRKEYEEVGTAPGILSIKFGVTPTSIYAHIKLEEWKRANIEEDDREEEDLEDLEEAMVNLTDEDLRNAINEINLYAGQKCVARLWRELDRKTPQLGEIERLISDETSGSVDYRRKKVLRYMMTLPSRANAAKALASAIKTLKEIEFMMDGVDLTGRRGKKDSLQEKAEHLSGKFAIPEINVKKAA